MNQFEFLKYEPNNNPEDKHIGIATVRCWGKIILRYKIVPGKDGRGFFVAAGSFKSGFDPSKGKDKYENYFMPDSSYEKEQIEDLIRDKVADAILANDTAQNAVPPMQSYGSTASIAPGPTKWAPTQSASDEVPF